MAVFADDEESAKEYNRLRRDVGADDATLTDILAEDYFLEAQEYYPSNVAKMKAYARVIALKSIRASAALLGKYALNQHEEDFSKVFANISEMLKDAVADVALVTDLVDEDTADPLFFGVAQGQRGR